MTVTIPLAYRGILAGVLIGFVRAMSEFGATIIVAGNIPGRTQTLALALFTDVQIGDNASALRLAGVAVGLANYRCHSQAVPGLTIVQAMLRP